MGWIMGEVELQKLELATKVDRGKITHFAETCTRCGRAVLGHRESEVAHYERVCPYCEADGGYIAEAFFVLQSSFRYVRRVIYDEGSSEIQVSNDLENWAVYERG